MRKAKRIVAGLLAFVLVGMGSGALAQSITVEAQVVGGTRAHTLKTLGGDDLTAVAFGASGSFPFLSNVTDLQYDRTGYQVTATLSDLYAWDGADFECGTKLDASAVSLGWAVDPTSVTDVEALPSTVWDLTGQLDSTLASLLGVSDGTTITVTDLAGEQIDRALAGVFDGLEDSLPIQVDTGTGGAFTNPAPHSTCEPAPADPATVHSIQEGSPNDLTALFNWVTNEVTDAADVDTNGDITGTELVDSGEVTDADLAEAVRQALADAGVNLGLLDTLLAAGDITMDDIYALLTATLDPITSLLGQTGTYLSVPELSLSVPGGVPGGTYRGTMTVTLLDV